MKSPLLFWTMVWVGLGLGLSISPCLANKKATAYSVEQEHKQLLLKLKKEQSDKPVQAFLQSLSSEINQIEKATNQRLETSIEKAEDISPDWKQEENLVKLLAWQEAFELYEKEKNCTKLVEKLILKFAPQANSESDLPPPAKAALTTCKVFFASK